MTRLAVLGNSHVASLKQGWEALKPRRKAIRSTFFADRAKNMDHLDVRGQRLIPTTNRLLKSIRRTSGGLSSIDVNQFDVFLVYGLNLSVVQMDDERFSSAVIAQAIEDGAKASLSFRTVERLRAAGAKRILVGHCPLRAHAAGCRDYPEGRYEFALDVLRTRVFAQPTVTVLAQPRPTIRGGLWTLEKYSIGSVRLDIGDKISGQPHPEGDRDHMNGDFGALYWEVVFTALGEGSGSPDATGRSSQKGFPRGLGSYLKRILQAV